MIENSAANAPLCLNTRPAHQSKPLTQAMQESGFQVLNFPTIRIAESPQTSFLQTLSEHIAEFDIALFVSRNAVDYAFKYLQPEHLPQHLEFGVIGKGTWQALRDQGVESQIIPTTSFNSEGLLAAENLQQVRNKKIIIFRGQEGRNLLGDTLRERGANVTYCEIYRRALPEYPAQAFTRLTQARFPDIAIFTSAEGLQNCFNLLDEAEWKRLNTISWLLISERMRETALKLGHNAGIIIARNASDEGILQTLQEWHNTRL
jgi:uroporphyrinogen-III synthase